MYRSFGYNDSCCGLPNAGNDRIRETDARGNDTLYKVDPDTSKVTELTDRCGNKTQYTYDDEGNTTRITSYNKSGTKLSHAAYTYDAFNNMTGVTRSDGMKYELSYNEFHKLSAIGINGKTDKLVSYEYKEGNGRLKKIHYANGDMMKLTYNRMGQVMSEKWYSRSNTLTAHYKYTYDGDGDIVRSIDLLNKREYNYLYDNEHIAYVSECSIVVNSNETVTKKTLINSIRYLYDKDGQLLKEVRNGVTINEMTYDNLGNIKSKNKAPYTYGTHTARDRGETFLSDAAEAV